MGNKKRQRFESGPVDHTGFLGLEFDDFFFCRVRVRAYAGDRGHLREVSQYQRLYEDLIGLGWWFDRVALDFSGVHIYPGLVGSLVRVFKNPVFDFVVVENSKQLKKILKFK